ncbi:hypothetical protein G6F27_014286 [Rhizopus arrhizus]|nr:hypothetical protein G6F27_014286 [Rhizopus arrhizus]
MLSDKLGDLKNELRSNDHIIEAVFVSCKLYGYKTKNNDIKSHAKGVRGKSADLFDKLTAMLNEPQEFTVPQMMTGRMKKAKGDLDVYDTLISKVLSGSYSKRRINFDGSTTAYIHK